MEMYRISSKLLPKRHADREYDVSQLKRIYIHKLFMEFTPLSTFCDTICKNDFRSWDRLRSNLGIICRPGSFADPYVTRSTTRASRYYSSVLFSSLKNSSFPLAQGIKVHIFWILFLISFPAIAVKNLQMNLAKLTILIRLGDNIHERAPGMCVDPRGYMTSEWRNLFLK